MTVHDGLNDLAPEELGLELRHLSVWLHLEVAMKAATIHELHDEEDLLVRLKYLVKLGDVLLIELLHDLHLSLDRFATIRLHQLGLLVDFHSNLLVQRPV